MNFPEDQKLRDQIQKNGNGNDLAGRLESMPQEHFPRRAVERERPKKRFGTSAGILPAVPHAEKDCGRRLQDKSQAAWTGKTGQEIVKKTWCEQVEVAGLDQSFERAGHSGEKDHKSKRNDDIPARE
jgi:hypothetical protein